MTDFKINIIADPKQVNKGMDAVDDRLEKTEKKADGLGDSLKRALALVGIGATIRQLGKYADTYTNIQNRVRGVTDSIDELNVVTNELFDISQKTRSSLQSTTELYTRTALAVKELGISQRQTLEFTQSLNEAVVLSGASAIEAEAGIVQLAQGLASGVLQGDELRSVLEQLPAVADVISKSLGVTRGELRKLGSEGKITAQVVLDAFKEAREELSERFAKTVPTLGQSFQVLQNSIIVTVGELDKTFKVSETLSKGILSLSQNIDTLARSLIVVSGIISVYLVRRGLLAAVSAVKALTVAIATNPLGAIAVAALAATAAVSAFADQITITEDSLVTVADVGKSAFDELSVIARSFADNFGYFISGIGEDFGLELNEVKLDFESFLRFSGTVLDTLNGLFRGAFFAILETFSNLPTALKALFLSAMNGVVAVVETSINTVVDGFNTLFDAVGVDSLIPRADLGRIESEAFSVGEKIGNAAVAGFESATGASEFVDRVIEGAGSVAADRIAKQEAERARRQAARQKLDEAGGVTARADAGFTKITQNLERQNDLLRVNVREREILAGVFATEKSLKRELTASEEAYVTQLLKERQALEGLPEVIESLRTYEENELAYLQTSLNERQTVIQSAIDARVISEQQGYDLMTEAARKYNEEVKDIEVSRYSSQLRAGESTFASLADIAKTYAGEQSKTYSRLFKISKAFAIADSTLQIANGISKAANNPWPTNLAAMASVAASTAGLVSQIQGTQYAGEFENGGQFTVGGSGGTDSQMVSFRATPGEQVRVSTPQQEFTSGQRSGESGQMRATFNFGFFNAPEDAKTFLASQDGKAFMIDYMDTNKNEIKATLEV
jgi:tape measure domain-containing protein